MKNPKPEFSEYKGMWLFVLFDLPVESKSQRRQYARFRVALLKLGFTMLQYSVYARYCPSEEIDQSYRKKVKEVIPPEGQVRLLSVTDRQFGKMEVFFGKKRKPTEDPPTQLSFF